MGFPSLIHRKKYFKADAMTLLVALKLSLLSLFCIVCFGRKYSMDSPWLVVEAMKKSFECFKIDRQISPKKAP